MYYNSNRLKINDWLNDPNVEKGCTKKNLDYIRQVNDLYDGLTLVTIISFFCIEKLKMNEELYAIFVSAKKQRDLLVAVRLNLKEHLVTPKYENAIKADLNLIERRIAYVKAMIKENLRMTEHWPFFEQGGWEKLDEISHIRGTKEFITETRDAFFQELIDYHDSHPDEIAVYMESIKEEKENMERHREKVKLDAKREKEEARAAKKAQKEFDKETQRILKEQKQRDKKIERSFERYYRRGA